MSAPPLLGPVLRLGDDVNTDVILPGRFLTLTDPVELGAHLLETYPGDAGERVTSGTVIVAGRNFGCGSSREQAPVAMLARGVQAVIASSFARIFFRNAINLGLPVLECRDAAAALRDGETVQIDRTAGTITSGSGAVYRLPPEPDFIAHLLQVGGLVPWVRQRLDLPPKTEQADAKATN